MSGKLLSLADAAGAPQRKLLTIEKILATVLDVHDAAKQGGPHNADLIAQFIDTLAYLSITGQHRLAMQGEWDKMVCIACRAVYTHQVRGDELLLQCTNRQCGLHGISYKIKVVNPTSEPG